MAEMPDSEERTQQATRLRLAEARRRGDVPRSADLVAVLTGLGAVAMLAVTGGWILDACVGVLRRGLTTAADDLSRPVPAGAAGAVMAAAAPALVLAGGVLAVAVLAGVVQVGVLLSGGPVQPRASRLSLAAGLRQMVSLDALVRGLLAVGKIAAAAALVFVTLRSALPRLAGLSAATPAAAARAAGRLALGAGLRVGLVLLALGVLDYLYRRWRHRQRWRMSRRELAEETRRVATVRRGFARRTDAAGRARPRGQMPGPVGPVAGAAGGTGEA